MLLRKKDEKWEEYHWVMKINRIFAPEQSASMYKLHVCTIIRIRGSSKRVLPFFNNKTMKIASTVEQQIELLRQRGMVVEDEEKAKEILLDISKT